MFSTPCKKRQPPFHDRRKMSSNPKLRDDPRNRSDTYFSSSLSQYRVWCRCSIRRVAAVTLQLGIFGSMIHPSANLDGILPYPITDAVVVGFLKGLLTYGARGVSKSMITRHKNEFVLRILLRRLCCGSRLCLGGFCSIGHGIFAFFRDFSPLDPFLDMHISCRNE